VSERKPLAGVTLGFGVTGSHCTLKRVMRAAAVLAENGAELHPVLSPSVRDTDTRFGTAASWRAQLESLSGHGAVTAVAEAEPIGPKRLFDGMIIAPASGNTVAKLVSGIVDTAVLMAAKAQLRNGGPLIVAVSTNDGLGINGKNIGLLCNMKNVYVVPFGQDDPVKKPNSVVAKMELLPETTEKALKGQQIQPILIEY
jgi:dipicolinate synthase subunit B